MTSPAAVLRAWASTRVTLRMTPEQQSHRRTLLWERLRPHLASTPAHAQWARAPLSSVPVRDVTLMRDDPAAWNSLGLGADECMAAAHDAERGGTGIVACDVVAGLSTGTTGRRGLFLASAAERAEYVGQSIASLLPWHAPVTGARIALILRADSEMYRDVGRGRFAFLHLPLGLEPNEAMDRLAAFAPTVLIAPPRELSQLATLGRSAPASLKRILWGSEPMGAMERIAVGEALGVRPDPIWQATEGFLGSACPMGTLHVNGGSIELELDPVPGVDAWRAVVTDMRRTTQPIVRMRMDDLVRPLAAACSCGRGGMALHPVEGRIQDVWRTRSGPMLPGDVDAVFEEALGPCSSWSVTGSPSGVSVLLSDRTLADAAANAVAGIHPGVPVSIGPMPAEAGPKRRRIQWRSR